MEDEDNRGIYKVLQLGTVQREERPVGKNGKFKMKGQRWTDRRTPADL